jgi:DNA-binding NarL/FixJ family response regulator
MSIKILVCDDLELSRSVIQQTLKSAPDIEVVGEADGGESAIALTALLHPDVVLMDIVMLGVNGIDATRQILRETGRVKVLAVSMHSDQRYVRAMIAAGASGYVLKNYAHEELVRAIRAAVAGETYLSPCLEGNPDSRRSPPCGMLPSPP